MKLYDYPLAFNPAKARLILVETKTPYKTQFINIFTGHNISPEFLRINPAGTVPVLMDNDQVVTESLKVVQYVDNKAGKPLGGNDVDRAFEAEWLAQVDQFDGNLFFLAQGPADVRGILTGLGVHRRRICEGHLKRNPDMAVVYNKKIAAINAGFDAVQDPAAVAENLAQLMALLDRAEERLAVHSFLGGAAYSISDVMLTPALHHMESVAKLKEYLATRPKVAAYYLRLKARPSFKKVFGTADSGTAALRFIVPALLRSKFAGAFNWY